MKLFSLSLSQTMIFLREESLHKVWQNKKTAGKDFYDILNMNMFAPDDKQHIPIISDEVIIGNDNYNYRKL